MVDGLACATMDENTEDNQELAANLAEPEEDFDDGDLSEDSEDEK